MPVDIRAFSHVILPVSDLDASLAFFHEALDFLAGEPADMDALVAMVLRVGAVNLRVMELVEELGMGIAFPTRTVHLVQEAEA